MARSIHPNPVSPLITGGIFAQRTSRSSRAKQEPKSREMIRDYGELLEGLMRALTEVVDHAFPNADFLHRDHVAGSGIERDTKLSFILRATFGLSQMALKPELIENFQKTLKKHLDNVQHNPAEKGQYTGLLNIIKTYKSLAKAIIGQQQIKKELFRLNDLDLASKTIDRRLRLDWVDPTIRKPVVDLTSQVAKTMRSSERFQSNTLAGCNNSLASLSRLMVTSDTSSRKSKHSETFPKSRENNDQDYQHMAAPAA